MNRYRLTLDFTAPPSSMTLFEEMTGEQIVDFLPITKEEMAETGIDITSFGVMRLDADGRPIEILSCETVAELSVEDQANIITQGDS